MASKLDPIRSFVEMQVDFTLSDLLANGSAGQQIDLFRRGELQAVVTANFSGPAHKQAILQETLHLTRALSADSAVVVCDVMYTATSREPDRGPDRRLLSCLLCGSRKKLR